MQFKEAIGISPAAHTGYSVAGLNNLPVFPQSYTSLEAYILVKHLDVVDTAVLAYEAIIMLTHVARSTIQSCENSNPVC